MTDDPSSITDSPAGEPVSQPIDSPVGESKVDPSDLHLVDLVSWFGGDKETADEIVKGFKGNLFRTIMWAMRYSVDRDGYTEAPDYDKESDAYFGILKTMPKLYSGFAKCQSYHMYNMERHEVDRKKAAGEKFEKSEKPEESLNPCRMPGCLSCYGHQLLKDLSALNNAFQSAPSGSTFEIRSSALPANFNTTSVPSKTGKPENAPILEAVTGRTRRVRPGRVCGDMRGKVRGKAPGSEAPGVNRTQVLRVTSLDAPTQGEVQEILGLEGEEHALIKRITAVSFTPFTRTPLSDDAVHAIGGQVLDLCRVAAVRRQSDGTTDSDHDNENVHRDLVSYVYQTPKVREVLPSGTKTDRFALVRSIYIDVDDRDSLKHLIEAYLFLNPPPFNAARALRGMEDDAEAFMASVKAPNEKTHWLSGEFYDTSKVRALKALERERSTALVDPKNFNQRPPDPDELRQHADKKKHRRQHALDLAEKKVLEDLEEKRLKEKLQNEKEANARQARAPLRYRCQLDHLRRLRVSMSSLTVEQLLSDEHLDFTPLFRYVIGAHDGLPSIMDANREGARAELLAYPVARKLFGDLLGSL